MYQIRLKCIRCEKVTYTVIPVPYVIKDYVCYICARKENKEKAKK